MDKSSNIIDMLDFKSKLEQDYQIDHEDYSITAASNLIDKTYFDSGITDIDVMTAYHEMHLYLLSFEFDLEHEAFAIDRENQSRGIKYAGVTTAFDLLITKMMADLEECLSEGNLPNGLKPEHFEGIDLSPYCISLLTNEHRPVDLRAPFDGENFDALLLVTPQTLAFFERYVRKFRVTTFESVLSYTDGAITRRVKITPYHRSFGTVFELIEGKVDAMELADLQPIMPGADPIMELPFRMEFDTDFYRWQEGRDDDHFDDEPDGNDHLDDHDDTVVSIH